MSPLSKAYGYYWSTAGLAPAETLLTAIRKSLTEVAERSDRQPSSQRILYNDQRRCGPSLSQENKQSLRRARSGSRQASENLNIHTRCG